MGADLLNTLITAVPFTKLTSCDNISVTLLYVFAGFSIDQELNPLDLGVSRFLEHNFVLVWKVKLELEQCRAAAQALLI